MSYRLWWRRNDGIGGHVWLSDADLRLLADEMVVQGMPWPGDRLAAAPRDDAVIAADEVEDALAAASPDPVLLADRKLWQDWLAFLEGAARNGGVLVRGG